MNAPAATAIARAAIARVNPMEMITAALQRDGEMLSVRTETDNLSVDLSAYRRIVVLGAGKAAAAMATGVERVLGDRIERGLIVTKYGHRLPLSRIETIEAGHPVPDENSLRAGREIAAIARDLEDDTLCITLVSGGGSALLTVPAEFADHRLSLQDVQDTTERLLAAGAPIQDVNCLRRHLSGIAGGRYAGIAAPARTVALILSDVVGDELESIASGLVAPDPTTFADALAVVHRYGIGPRLPEAVTAFLTAGVSGEIPDTPTADDPAFARLSPVLIGTNARALDAAREAASRRGYRPLVLTSQLTGEAREIAQVFAAIARDVVRGTGPVRPPACILAGGETTVTLRGSGLGGRNQEMALAVLASMVDRPAAFRGVTFLSVGTDGTDGPTDAAGGFAAPTLLAEERGDVAGLVARALADNDAYHALDRLGGLFRTGPTNTNVCDVQILLVDP